MSCYLKLFGGTPIYVVHEMVNFTTGSMFYIRVHSWQSLPNRILIWQLLSTRCILDVCVWAFDLAICSGTFRLKFSSELGGFFFLYFTCNCLGCIWGMYRYAATFSLNLDVKSEAKLSVRYSILQNNSFVGHYKRPITREIVAPILQTVVLQRQSQFQSLIPLHSFWRARTN